MSEFEDLMNTGLKEAERHLPSKIKIGANEYPCITSEATLEDSAAFGGIEQNITAIVILRKQESPTRPIDKSTVILNGDRRRIAGVTDDGATWNIGISE